MEMKAGGYLTDGTELRDTNFARIAGVRNHGHSRGKILRRLMRRCNAPHPVTVRFWSMSFLAKEELAIPPQIKLEQAKGFSLYMLRAIISGRGDEVIELAKTNWLR